MDSAIRSPKKLIEVALPLDVINQACVREKSIRHGHPSTLHLWWARRPLAAARAVIFAQLVNDPESIWREHNPMLEPSPQQRGRFTRRRNELFQIIKDLVVWENTANPDVLEQAKEEIRRSWKEVCELNRNHPDARSLFDPEQMPGLHDPFAGGGAIPLEAQRLGLAAYASDLNPVAVLINKAMIEIPRTFRDAAPVSRGQAVTSAGSLSLFASLEATGAMRSLWGASAGLAEDVRYYGEILRKKAAERIGHLYPPVEITSELAVNRPDLKPYINRKLTVIAWIWTRTVASPNPAFGGIHVPLASTFVLSGKGTKEAYVEPIIRGREYKFEIKLGSPSSEAKAGTTAGKRKGFRCLLSGAPIDYNYVRAEGRAGRMSQRLMAVVLEGDRGRIYLPPSKDMEDLAASAIPNWRPEVELHGKCRVNVSNYGLDRYGDLFTNRQLVALNTFSELIGEVRRIVEQDAILAGMTDDQVPLDSGGSGARAYAEAVSVYLAFQVDQTANHLSTVCAWHVNNEQLKNTFARQAIPFIWDFAETNPFSTSTGSLLNLQERQVKGFYALGAACEAHVYQADAQHQVISRNKFISTDPPYYDNISYADLSDFFYVWTRRNLQDVFPALLTTIAVPKAEELVATPYRHGSTAAAEKFFMEGMSKAMQSLRAQAHPAAPITIYYAFKQSDTKSDVTSSTGWETFLEAVFRSGFVLVGTWPFNTEQTAAIKTGMNYLASSIVLVCRQRDVEAPQISRREFLRELNAVLPKALDDMTKGAGENQSPVAPVDLSQAIIGPGMAVFSKYQAILEPDGSTMTVKTALQLINRFLAEDDFDSDTQFCLHWFEQNGWDEGGFGQADLLARSKATGVDGLSDAGVLSSRGGKVRLFRWSEYPAEWDPRKDKRRPVWEALHHLIRALKAEGETGAAKLLKLLENQAEAIRQLAYRLYTLCERQGRAEDAGAYNELITSWSEFEAIAASTSSAESQIVLFGGNS